MNAYNDEFTLKGNLSFAFRIYPYMWAFFNLLALPSQGFDFKFALISAVVLLVTAVWGSLLKWLLNTERWVWAIVTAAPFFYLLTLTD